MVQQVINVGAAPNDGQGDPIRTAYIKCNDNFTQLYSRAQTIPPSTLIGTVGDQAGMYAYDSTYFYYCYANYDGVNPIWAQITQAGNVSVTNITNGTSNVTISNVSGNITVGVNGVANVAQFTPVGVFVTGRLSVTGNIATNANVFGGVLSASGNIVGNNIQALTGISTAGNITGDYILGNGSQLTGLPATYANSNVAAYLPTYSGDFTANNISTVGNVVSQGIMSATGNIVTAGYFVGNFVGNITGNLVVPGSNTQVIFNSNGNASATGGLTFNTNGPNLLTVLGAISSQGNVIAGNVRTTGLITATGNITSGNLITSGTVINSGVSTTGLVSATGNITGGNILTGGVISSTGNATYGNILTGGLISATSTITSSANIIGVNILTGGQVSAVGNISTSGIVYATGNITSGGNVSATVHTGTSVSVTGNVISGNVLSAGVVSAVGNIVGSYIFGNGSQLTGLPTQYSNANVAAYLPIYSGNLTANIISAVGTVVTPGNIYGGNLFATSNVYINGNVLTRSLTVGTRSAPVTIPLTGNSSFPVLTRNSGNVIVTTTT